MVLLVVAIGIISGRTKVEMGGLIGCLADSWVIGWCIHSFIHCLVNVFSNWLAGWLRE